MSDILDRQSVTAAAFDESKHPREQAGTRVGGRFRAKVGDTVILPGGAKDVVTSVEQKGVLTEARTDGGEVITVTPDGSAQDEYGSEVTVRTPTERDLYQREARAAKDAEYEAIQANPYMGLNEDELIQAQAAAEALATDPDNLLLDETKLKVLPEWAKVNAEMTRRGMDWQNTSRYGRPADYIGTPDGILEERRSIEGRFKRGELTSSEAQHLTEQAWAAHERAKRNMQASGYVSEQAARREFLSSLTAAAKSRNEKEEAEEDPDEALTAAAVLESRRGRAPANPPRDWFETPEIDSPFPLTITADGQVMGHVAVWGQCHTGFPGRCTQPPPSPSGYSFFHTGAIETEDGSTIPVGRLTFDTGHAALTASRAQAAAHYDNTGKVGAYVRAIDGKHGIWVCGATRCDLGDPELQTLRASAPSGDWRRPAPGKPMEMVGLLGVNVAGFPVPRGQALVASVALDEDEEIMSLVAAGFEDTVAMAEEFYSRQIEVLAMIAAGTLNEFLMTPLERIMAGTAASR